MDVDYLLYSSQAFIKSSHLVSCFMFQTKNLVIVRNLIVNRVIPLGGKEVVVLKNDIVLTNQKFSSQCFVNIALPNDGL